MPAEVEYEVARDLGPIDDVEGQEEDEEQVTEPTEQEKNLLEEMPLPNMPMGEAERRAEWTRLPRTTRAAIRKMHSQFGHCPKQVLIQILKQSKASDEFVDAAR